MSGTTRVLTFAEGVYVSGPSQNFLETTTFAVYAGTAAYVTAKGSAATLGDVFCDSLTNTILFYDGTRWQTIDNIKNKYNGTTGPVNTDDNTQGYVVGSKWFDTTNDKIYFAIDVTTNAAIWLEYGGPFIGINEVPVGLVNNTNTDFTISALPIDGTLIVKRDGLIVPISEYSFVHPVISLTTAPAYGQKIEAYYLSNGTSATQILTLTNQIVENRTVSAGEITAKKLVLSNTPGVPTEVVCDMRSGSIQVYGVDFNIINGNELNWSGFAMDGVVLAGSILRITYFI